MIDDVLSPVQEMALYAQNCEINQGFGAQQLQVMYEQKWFKIYVPALYGGLGLTIPEGVRLSEDLAYAEGNAGWLCTLSSGASIFAGFLKPAFARQVFENPKVSFAGSGKAEGVASVIGDAYVVAGVWPYASGADIATVFTANCKLQKDGIPILDEAGNPVIKAFAFLREEVLIHPNWHTMGLKATSGHTIEVRNLRVTEERIFELKRESAHINHLNYAYPFQQFAEITLAVNTIGMGLHFVDLVGDFIDRKKELGLTVDTEFEKSYMTAQVEIESSKSKFYEVLDASWICLKVQNEIPQNILNEVSQGSKAIVKLIQNKVAKLYPYCGMQAAQANSEMNKVWRDLFTASQHQVLL
jgi:alkylation response protein AidB-like acyl-CoA dehydrogenase